MVALTKTGSKLDGVFVCKQLVLSLPTAAAHNLNKNLRSNKTQL